MVNYFPKINSRKFGIRQEIYPTQFTRFYSKRRYNFDDIFKLINVIWFYTFLIFAFRIGGAALFTMFDMAGMNAAINSNGITLPKAENKAKRNFSGRNLLYISIHEDGHVRVALGAKIYTKDFVTYFKNSKLSNPQVVAFLIVDKNCKMIYVNQVIQALRKADLRKIIFFTSKSGNISLGYNNGIKRTRERVDVYLEF